MTRNSRTTTFMMGASLAAGLLLRATPAIASDATEDTEAFDAQAEQRRPTAPVSADTAAPFKLENTERNSIYSSGSGGGEPSRANARYGTDANQGADDPSEEYETQQKVWTAP